MNDFHLLELANATISERRAEADRHRLARTAGTARRRAGRAADAAQQSLSRPRFGLSAFLRRPALR